MPQRILIVEPEPHAREGLRALLAAAGHEVSVAEDITAGFARVSSGPFDLLILDADLPGRGGCSPCSTSFASPGQGIKGRAGSWSRVAPRSSRRT